MKSTWNKIRGLISGQRDLASVGLVDIVNSGIGAVFWFYIALILGAEQYGQLSYFLAIAGAASTVSLIGSQSTITVYAAKNVKILSTVYFLTLISGSIAAIVVFFMLYKTEISLYVVCAMIFNLSVSEILGRKLFVTYAKYALANKILTIVLSIGLYYIIGFQGIILGIALAYSPYFIRIYKCFRYEKIDFTLLKPRLGFMITGYLTSLSGSFNGLLDKLIIAPLLGFAILGNYQLGLQFFSILYILPVIIYKYTLPYDSVGNPKKKLKELTILASVVIAVLGVVISPILVSSVFPKYTEAIGVIQIISPAIIPGTITLMYISKFLGSEKNRIILIGSILNVVIQLVSVIILGQMFGVNGAAVALDIAVVSEMIFFIIADRFVKESKKL
jgi:O-antigen/teichoic acid export membrane protein